MSGYQTNMHLSRTDALTLLEAVQFTQGILVAFQERDIDHDLSEPVQLDHVERMLRSALVRIQDLEAKRSHA